MRPPLGILPSGGRIAYARRHTRASHTSTRSPRRAVTRHHGLLSIEIGLRILLGDVPTDPSVLATTAKHCRRPRWIGEGKPALRTRRFYHDPFAGFLRCVRRRARWRRARTGICGIQPVERITFLLLAADPIDRRRSRPAAAGRPIAPALRTVSFRETQLLFEWDNPDPGFGPRSIRAAYGVKEPGRRRVPPNLLPARIPGRQARKGPDGQRRTSGLRYV
jgi:hypothetical protein